MIAVRVLDEEVAALQPLERDAASHDGVWRIWRDQPGFDQRFAATLGRDSFEGVFELAETPGEWQQDMTVVYRRRA